MDWRKLVGKTETLVLPYTGGTRVDAQDRRLRVTEPVTPGWWSFRVEGRRATATAPADTPDLSRLPSVRGHFAHGWVAMTGSMAERPALLPQEEPQTLAPIVARRWSDDVLVFSAVDFESEAEEAVRRALEEGRAISSVKAVTPSLRAAFAYCTLFSAGNRLNIPISMFESKPHVARVCDGGRAAAETILRGIEEVRAETLAEINERAFQENRNAPRTWQGRSGGQGRAQTPTLDNAPDRIEAALLSANAELRSTRRVANGGEFEVVYTFLGERFISRVEGLSLNVVDAGICLDGEDSLVTLESLPGVIREAIRSGRLVITRR